MLTNVRTRDKTELIQFLKFVAPGLVFSLCKGLCKRAEKPLSVTLNYYFRRINRAVNFLLCYASQITLRGLGSSGKAKTVYTMVH